MKTGIPEDLQVALGTQYDLQRILGRGGMATVYLAGDRKHRREVAIKVLRPDLAASIGAGRFLIEIEIAARLTHPHILPLHDSGESGGFLYYVRPYIDGGSLRSRLDASKTLDVTTALGIATAIGGALSYAHRMNVVHRDIKPENILFAQGLPIVADFGIAKAISTAGGENLTRTGFPLGTPGYMSPEQAAGLTDLDASTDVYALAVVCYEMLIGALPGRWPTESAVQAGRFLEAPGAHRAALDALPSGIETALVRAMAIRHDQRTRSAEAFIEDVNGRTREAATSPGRRVGVTASRRYGEQDVQEIIKRASEMEASQPTLGGSLTIGAVQQVAAEAGIDPRLVRQAAGELAAPAAERPSSERTFGEIVAGGPLRLAFERVVRGEVPDAEFPLLIEEVRSVIGGNGIVGTLGRSVSYTTTRVGSSGMGRDIQVTIAVRAGATRITIREGLGQSAGAIFGGICGGVGGGGLGPLFGVFLGGLHAPAAALAAIPLWLTAVFATARSTYHYSARRKQKELEGLANRLAMLAAEVAVRVDELPAPPAGRLGPG